MLNLSFRGEESSSSIGILDDTVGLSAKMMESISLVDVTHECKSGTGSIAGRKGFGLASAGLRRVVGVFCHQTNVQEWEEQ